MFFRSRTGTPEWMVVFLGNPGARFAGTRHNAGFMTADAAERALGIKIDRAKFRSLTCTAEVSGAKVLFLKPQTYMNLSGDAVRQAMAFYKIPLDRIIVVSDDTALPVGRLRIRRNGSAGGHNGLKDIIEKCGGDGFVRLRIGVGEKPYSDYDMADWVLSVFRNGDAELMEEAAGRAVDAVKSIIADGVDAAMNTFNQK